MDPELLDDVVAFIGRYVVLTPPQMDATGLFVMHTHTFEAADATPYLAITSAEKRSGKTRLLEALELLVPRPWLTGRASTAVLTRKIDQECPTLLLDESDAAFKGPEDYREALRAVLNSGYRRGGRASLCVGAGAAITFRDFSTFCPKAIAGIGKLPDTVADRAIPIRLERRGPDEQVARFRRRDVEREAAPLRARLQEAGSAALGALRDARPSLPSELDDRAADCWEPLLAIADLASPEWSERARAAARCLSAHERDDDSLGVKALRDIREVFDHSNAAALASVDLREHLIALDDSTWADFKGKQLTGRQLGDLLRPYRISARTIRISATTARGFRREQFEDAWRRYLPDNPSHASHLPSAATPPPPVQSVDREHVTFRPEGRNVDGLVDVTHVRPSQAPYIFDSEDDPDAELARITAKFGGDLMRHVNESRK